MKKILPFPLRSILYRSIKKAGTGPGDNEPATTTQKKIIMKKLPGILLLSLILVFGVNLCFAQSTPGTAENFTVNGTANSTIGGANQDHWYKVITTADGDIGVSSTASTTNGNQYTYLYLYDADASTQLGASSNYASNGAVSFTTGGLAAGTYYILLRSTDAFSNTYSITNTLTQSSLANDVEQNGTPAQAITMTVGSNKTGHIAYRGNGGVVDADDYYKITTAADGDITVSLTGDRPSGYVYIYLYDNDGTAQLGAFSDYIMNGPLSFTVGGLAAGTYYIRVNEAGNSSYTAYTLTASLTTSSLANDAELNDFFIQANTIDLVTPKTGHIAYRRNGGQADANDYYKLVTTNDGDITVTLTGDRNSGYVYLYLYDKDTVTQLIGTSNYIMNGPISFTKGGLAAGTYYILVNEAGNSSYTGYTLSASLATAPSIGDTEPNDVPAQAGPFAVNGTVSGHIGYRNNGGTVEGSDYYKIITTQDGDINLSLTGDRPSGYVYLTLYDSDGTTQLISTSNYISGAPIGFTKFGLAAGTYYVLVYEPSNSSYTGYTLTNTFTPAPYNNDVEPNNTTATASLLNLNTSKSGHIGYRNNGGAVEADDYWKIIMNNTDSFHVVINMSTNNSSGYVYIYLYDGSSTQIYSQSDYTNNRTVYDIYFPSLAAGTYYLRISEPGNANYCSYTIPVFHVPCFSGASVITAGGPTTFCQGGSVALNTTATFTAYGQSNGYAGYLWSTNATSQNITATATGSYSVTATDVDGCAHASNIIPVTVNPIPATPTISTGGGATTFCQGGSVTLTSSAATGNTWSTNATTQAITVSTSGSYTVAVTANGCTSLTSAPTVVTVNPLPATPTISTGGGATTFCQGGSVTLTSSAATSYLWSNGATTQSITVSASGTFTVTVKNANGCSSAPSAATTVSVNPLPATPTIGAGGATTFCAPGSVTLTSSAATSYLWSNGATTQSITVSASGTFTVTVKNANGCSSAPSAATTVTVNPLPTVTLSAFTAVCSTDAAFTLSGGSPAGGTYSGTGVSGGQFNPATAGVGSFPITYSYTNANNCTATAQQTITVNNCTAPCNASISAGGPTTFCAGGNVTLTASAGVSWLWSNNATTQSITVSSTGNYSCAVTNANNCTATAPAVSVTVNPLPATPTISTGGAATTFCAGGSVTLTSSAATNNVWSNGATTQSITVDATGNYSVTVTNANNCSATSATTSVTVNPLPIVTLGQFAAKCSTDAAFALTGGSPAGGTYSGTGVSGGQFNPATAGVGTFTITYSYTNANNCTATAQQSITVNNCTAPCTATASAGGPTTFCAGATVVLTASAGVSYLWSNGATSSSITVSAGGNYSVAVTNANNCTATSNVIAVTVNPLPTVTLSAFAAKCSTDAAFALTGGSPAGGTYSGTGVSGGQFNPATAGVGTFSITYSYTNANGCTNTATQSITVNNCTTQCTATITANGPTTFCSGGSVKLTASAGASYLWSNGSTASNITVTNGGSYTVKITQSNGCFATSAATVVTVNALPSVPTITAGGPTTFCTPGSVTLTSSAATSYLWSNGATTQSIPVTSSGSYTVTVKNASGCSRTSAATVVTANNCGGTYCTANATSKNKGYINNVKFRTINNTSGWNGGYGNFTNLTATVNKMVCYSISVTPGYVGCSTTPLYTRVWIDWNHDGDFIDAGELVFAPSGASSGTRNGSVSVPCNALCGTTRMRVEMRADCNPSPCGTFTYGEVEDYTVNVSCSAGSKGIEEEKTDDIILSESFTVYPNPVSDEMLIRRSSNDNTTIVDANARLIVADMNGKIVLQSTLRKSTEVIDVRKWPQGIYVVQIKTSNGTTTNKVVVSH